MSVEVKLELGHRACLREKPTAEGFTHDWTVFVKGPGSGAEANSIQHFVDKVVFYLHESFPKPKRVIKEPPYQVSESGYASFIMPIEVFFRSKEEPKKVCFEYDLYLRIDGPPVSNIRYEKLTFQNPTEDFRRKLITAGGHLLGASGPTNPPPVTEHHVEDHRSTGSLKPPAASGEKKRHHSATKEISKPAPPPPPPPPPLLPPPAPSQQPFNEIFGSPINKPKHSLGSTSKTKEHSHSGPKSGKTVPVASSANKEAKLPSKETVLEAKESRSTKPPKQEKEPKPVKRVSPVQAHSDSTPPEKKRRTSSSSHDEKSDGAAKQKVREVKDREKHKTKSSSIAPAKREKDKTKNKSLTPPPKNKEPTKSPKLSAPAQRIDKYPSPLIESSSQEVCNSDASSKSSKPDDPVSPVPSTISESNKISRPLSALYDEGDDSLLSPMSSDEENVPHPAKEKEKKEDREISDSGNVQTSKTKPPTKTSSASEKKAVKQKSSAKSTKEHPKPAHSENHTTKDSHRENQTSNSSEKETKQKKPVSSSNISELVELQQKIMTLKDRNIMQRIVDVIEKTGQYHMTSSSFDFDLCSLDDSTLRKLTCLFVK